MGTTQNLEGREAIQKIKELAEKVTFCMFASKLTSTPLAARPMSTSQVDENGTIWFFSHKSSDTNKQIQADDRVQLFYANADKSEFVSLFGNARISTDRKKIEELWSPMLKTWFNEGKDDPEISLLAVTPQEGHYWDTKNNKAVAMMKIAIGAVTGKPSDDGLEGQVSF